MAAHHHQHHHIFSVLFFSKVLLLCALVSSQAADECPSLYGQVGNPQDLDIEALSVFLDPQDVDFLPGQINFIINGVSVYPFNSLSDLSNPNILGVASGGLPSNISTWHLPLRVKVMSSADEIQEDTLYYSISLTSINSTIAPAGCPNQNLGELTGNSTVINVTVTCEAQGVAIQKACLTIGTRPFDYLNGTYHTFTFFFPIVCAAPSPPLCPTLTPPILLAEMCISTNQSLSLVQLGTGSWSLLASVLRSENTNGVRGYCFIRENQIPPGLVILLSEDSINMQYAIPIQFDYFDIFIRISDSIVPFIPLSYSVTPVSENTSVLDHPVDKFGVPQQGIIYDGRVDFLFDLTCKNPGLSRVYVHFNISGLIDGVLYTNRYPDLYFYRDCNNNTNDVLVITKSNNLGIKVGIPLAVAFLFLMGGAGVAIVLMVYFTHHYRRKTFRLEQEHQLELLETTNNAYMQANFNTSLNNMSELNLEYNYSSLEVVGELGEGAFGRVFKAVAPGLQRGAERNEDEYVAIKTLKDGADLDVMKSFVAEVETSAQFDHPNVVKLLGICTNSPQKCMIFEYMDLGSLNDVLRKSDHTNLTSNSNGTSPKDAIIITPDLFLPCSLQIAQGLIYLATLKFVHRDIATRNCLVDHNLVVKIADFGMSRGMCASDYYKIGSATATLPVRWMPPEALLYGKFTVKSDVWSFGVLMWEIYTYAHQPYGGISNYEVIDRIKSGQILNCPDLCPASVFNIIKKCWTKVPQKRPHMSVIVSLMGHLLRTNSMNVVDDYMPMGTAEGYLNLSFKVVVDEKELKEKKRVDGILDQIKQQQQEEEDQQQQQREEEMYGEEKKEDLGRELEEVGGENQGEEADEDRGGEVGETRREVMEKEEEGGEVRETGVELKEDEGEEMDSEQEESPEG